MSLNQATGSAVAPRPGIVLIVEDDWVTRSRMADALRAHHYEIVEAADAVSALNVLKGGVPVCAIVLDLLIPATDAWTFRQRQLESARLARIPTIVTTRNRLRPEDLHVLRPSEVLYMPVTGAQLVAALAQVQQAVTLEPGGLFWSVRGEVACSAHVPPPHSGRWLHEAWCRVPHERGPHNIRYQCQHCAPNGSPIARDRAAGRTSDLQLS